MLQEENDSLLEKVILRGSYSIHMDFYLESKSPILKIDYLALPIG